jgi:ribonuclease D
MMATGNLNEETEREMMTIKRSITKEEIKDMPRAAFPGRIIVVQTEAEAAKAVSYLRSHAMVGIDSETRPSFKKGQLHKVALLQVSTDECCFLFRLNMIGLPQCVVDLLQDAETTKVGLSLKDDFMMLRKRGSFSEKGVVELQEYVSRFGIDDKSLQKIYAILFGEKISKAQQLTNWETDVLTDGQKMYGATDAWACLKIYHLLQELERTGDYELTPRPADF